MKCCCEFGVLIVEASRKYLLIHFGESESHLMNEEVLI